MNFSRLPPFAKSALSILALAIGLQAINAYVGHPDHVLASSAQAVSTHHLHPAAGKSAYVRVKLIPGVHNYRIMLVHRDNLGRPARFGCAFLVLDRERPASPDNIVMIDIADQVTVGNTREAITVANPTSPIALSNGAVESSALLVLTITHTPAAHLEVRITDDPLLYVGKFRLMAWMTLAAMTLTGYAGIALVVRFLIRAGRAR